MKKLLSTFFKYHFEWVFLFLGLAALAFLNPYIDNGSSICLFNYFGVSFCPGEGLGHSIAFVFRADFINAVQAHPIGPLAVLVMGGRILHLWKQALEHSDFKKNSQQ
ncbi:MAG: DUF2752 domain-containing protein [Balneolaceae bacterium]|nr:DUF2752 domain-containing protein [Balneolaceae bacterium]